MIRKRDEWGMSKLAALKNYLDHLHKKAENFDKSGLYITFLFVATYAVIMGVVCAIQKDLLMVAINFITAIVMIGIMIVFARIKSPRFLSWVVITFLYILMMLFLIKGGVGGVSIMWLLFVPAASTYFISLYYGGILSISLGISVTIYMFTPLHNYGYAYSEQQIIRFPVIYWAFLIIALVIAVRIDGEEERQKQLIEAAEKSNRLKSEFLANMSHEIRTPMNAIMGMCELSRGEEMSPAAKDANENIYSSGKTLMNIINDILDFSKIESGRMELASVEYKLSDILTESINMAVARKGSKNIQFAVDCNPDIPEYLCGDMMRIRQVIINLLTNAIKYTIDGGVLLKLDYRKETYGINLIITIRDTGIGIKKEDMGKIYNPYRRFDSHKTNSIEGTGLGLPITKQLVELMDGILSVKSEYGKGTEFRVVIPQQVRKEIPIARFDKTKDISILYYEKMKKDTPDFIEETYKKNFMTIVKRYNARKYICDTLRDVKREIRIAKYSHIILGQEEYMEDKDYFDAMSRTHTIIVIFERADRIPLCETIINVYKPFGVYKFTKLVETPTAKEEKSAKAPDISFTAPDAKVLVVDDNAVNLKVAEGFMKRYGIHIETAMSGFEAIEKVKNKKYDIIFMDHLMPEMDGVETFREIRNIENDYAKIIPVIALTANVAGNVEKMFMKEGFRGFMGKPIQSDVLNEILLNNLPMGLIVKNSGGV